MTQHHGEILIRFPVPEGADHTLAFEALAAAAKQASKIVRLIGDMGIPGATLAHRIYAHDPVHSADPERHGKP